MKIQMRTHLASFCLLGLIAAQLWVSVLWIQSDGGIGDGVCCSFTAPVLDILRADGTGQLGWPWDHYRRSMGLLVWPALLARKIVGPNVDFLLWLNLICILLTQGILYKLGRRMSGTFAGLLAAGLYPMIPAVAFMGRRWDAMIPQHLLLVAAAFFEIQSEGFKRWKSTTMFTAMAAMGSILSARETDNLLFMAAVGAIAVGTTLNGLVQKQRVYSLIGTVVVAAIMAVFMIEYAFPLVDFDYFRDEMGNQTYVEGAQKLSIQALTAYPLRMYSDDFTPWIIFPFLVSLIPFLRRGPGRLILGSWLLLPLLALSLVGKKNYYYAAIIYPAIPLILAVGLSRMKPRFVGIGVGMATLLVGWAQFSARSLPTSTFPASLSRVNWNGEAGPQKHLFQGIVPLNLGPRGPSDHAEAIELLIPRLTEDSCNCPNQVLFMGRGDPSDLYMAAAMKDPCLALSPWPRLDHAESVGWVIAESTGCTTVPPPVLKRGRFELIEAKGSGEECVALWGRTAKTPERFCGSKGAPPR